MKFNIFTFILSITLKHNFSQENDEIFTKYLENIMILRLFLTKSHGFILEV